MVRLLCLNFGNAIYLTKNEVLRREKRLKRCSVVGEKSEAVAVVAEWSGAVVAEWSGAVVAEWSGAVVAEWSEAVVAEYGVGLWLLNMEWGCGC